MATVPFSIGSASAAFDLATAFLGQPKTLAYGLVRGAGNLVFQQQLSDNSIVAFYLLGEGPWSSLQALWLNDIPTNVADASIVHFHNGFDGEIGFGMGAVSSGGDQHVDSFFGLAGIPGSLSLIDWSRYAYLGLHVPPNAAAPSAGLTVLADYQAMQCRIFDDAGNQTGFTWTQNPAWWICDFLLRKFILREAKIQQPLVAAELARFDWPAWKAAADYYDQAIPAGPARFSDGGVVFLQGGMNASNALEQMLLMCQSYLLDHNGKLSLYPDQPRASVPFSLNIDTVIPGSFMATKTTLRAGKNRITATWREEAMASGSSDLGTRMAICTRQFDHQAHQLAIGARGPGLSVMPCVNELQLDFGINTSERVSRLCSFLLLRQFGLDTDPNLTYKAPFQFEAVVTEELLAVEQGDIIPIDASISEEFAGTQLEVLQVEERPDGTRKFTCLEYISGAFGDSALPRQALQAPTPGLGLWPIIGTQSQDGVVLGRAFGKNMLGNPGFESNYVGTPYATDLPLGSPVTDEWYVFAKTPYHQVIVEQNNVPRSGGNNLVLRLAKGVTIPNGGGGSTPVNTKWKIPCKTGDIIRVSGWARFDRDVGATPPVGVTFTCLVGFAIFASDDTFLQEEYQSVLSTLAGFENTWTQLQASLQIPATISGKVPAYMRIECAFIVNNASGASFSTGTTFYCDFRFDDLVASFQSTAFDLTPLNTSATFTGGSPCSQSGTSTTVNIAATTMQYGDGQVGYNSGSINPGSYGTWFIYADDPTYSGGAVTYQATANQSDLYAANGRVYFGTITTVGGGGAVSINGGAGGGRHTLTN